VVSNFLDVGSVVVIVIVIVIVATMWPGEVRTHSRSWSGVGHTPVPLERVAVASARHSAFVLHVKADSTAKRAGDLAGRVAGDDVSADDVIGSSCLDQNPIRVSSDAVVLYQVAAAANQEADTEVVVAVSDRPIPAELVPPNAVVMTVDEAVATTRGRRRVFALLTETMSSMTLSDMARVRRPLKQLWCEVTSFTLAFVLTPIVPTMKIPCRRNFCTMPGPKTRACVRACAWARSEMRMPSA
jgi:hypothetical protein